MQRAVQIVGPGLRHHIDEPAGTAPELGRRVVGHHLKLFDGIQADRKRRPLPAALFPEKRIIIVGAVDGHIVIDALLPVDRNFIPVRSLHNGHTRSQRGKAQIIPSVVRQIPHRPRVEIGGILDPFALQNRRVRRDRHHLIHLRNTQTHGQRDRLPYREIQPLQHRHAEIRGLDGHLILAQRQQQPEKTPGVVRLRRARKVRAGVRERHRRFGYRAAGRIRNRALDGSRIRLRLREQPCGRQQNTGEKASCPAAFEIHP